jgi:hypothetical protein
VLCAVSPVHTCSHLFTLDFSLCSNIFRFWLLSFLLGLVDMAIVVPAFLVVLVTGIRCPTMLQQVSVNVSD